MNHLLIITGIFAVFFLAGYEDRLNQIDEASQADRERIYCASIGHSETYCGGKL